MGPKRVELLPELMSSNYLFQDRALNYVRQRFVFGKKGYERVHAGYGEVMMMKVMENERGVRLRMMLRMMLVMVVPGTM
jgi:hypothetical protein